MKKIYILAILCLGTCCISTVNADTFGTGINSFDIKFVTIDSPGNVADTTGSPNPAGSVAHEYRIGKYEISEDSIDKVNTLSSLDGNPLNISKDTRSPNKPAASISWFEAAHFVNWLNVSSGALPAYKFDGNGELQLWEPSDAGYNPSNLTRNSLATYFLPSTDEWYKAAYYNPISGIYYDYPTGSDTPPTPVASGTALGTAIYGGQAEPADIMLAGGLSPYKTMGQGGNVFEWEETAYKPIPNRGLRGGVWFTGFSVLLSSSVQFSENPYSEEITHGFRVASIIPEPATSALALTALFLIFGRGSTRQHQ